MRATAVLSVANDSACDVYDLTVNGAHEFFAGGLLVHNCDELCAWRYETTWHEGLVPALRKGEKPRIVVTTTPRPTKLIKDLLGRKDGSVHVTRGSTWENADNLSATALLELKRRYEGTRLGRQELEGEVLEDIEGALWQRSMIDADRVKPSDVPDLSRVVVAIDPAVTSNEDSDESGIVVVGYAGDHGYVLGDYSVQGTPNEVINKAVHAYRVHDADVIVAEVNNGGDWIGSLLRTVDTNIPYDTVRASRGKAIRAEPVSSLYEQHRMHHVGSFPQLEDQMCLVAGTMVETARGQVSIEDVCAGDMVMTRDGLAPVQWAGATGVAHELVSVAYAHGVVECTPCHPIFLADRREFASAHTVTTGHPLLVSRNWANTDGPSHGAAGGITAWHQATTVTRKASCCTGPCGNPTTDPSPPECSCTTSTTIPGTTAPRTSRCAPSRNTPPNTRAKASPACRTANAARTPSPGGHDGMSRNCDAPSVAVPSCPAADAGSSTVTSAVVSVRTERNRTGTRVPVFNLKVVDGYPPEFYANGVLVHNCGFVPGVTKESPDRMDALVWGATALTGIVAGDWNDAYGTVRCFTCAHVYVLASHAKCPKCGTMN